VRSKKFYEAKWRAISFGSSSKKRAIEKDEDSTVEPLACEVCREREATHTAYGQDVCVGCAKRLGIQDS
jgi:hypothetical protein